MGGKPCNGTHGCGWNDPDEGVRAACQHTNEICNDWGFCQIGPALKDAPMVALSSSPECKHEGKPCNGTHGCGWNDPDEGVRAACQHTNEICNDWGVCQIGPALKSISADCIAIGQRCKQ